MKAAERVANMLMAAQECGFGNCTNHYECTEACPKEIPVKFIAEMNRAYMKASFRAEKETGEKAGVG